MSASSELESETRDLLVNSRERLRFLADSDHDQVTPPPDQLQAENAVAAGVAMLAGEEHPDPDTTLPTRPILAKDLLLTVDLVLRALDAHTG